ncbi:MAG: twin-arginine translocation signal domain-containing protein, partial [Pyrinomonadaceae bacterium]
MTDPISRRDLIKGLGAIGASGTLNTASASQAAPSEINRPLPQAVLTVPFKDGEITNLTSTSEVFIPPRGRAFMKFSFDFPEPVVAFGEHRFGFLVFTAENAYGLDREKMRVEAAGNSMTLKCDGFVWAGGQERARGSLTATFRKEIGKIEWDVTVEMEQPIKTVTTVIRDVPRGQVSFGGGALTDPRDNELLSGYPFGGGDLHGPGAANSMSTPLAVIQTAADDFVFIEPLDDKVRPKRFYFQPGENFYRVEAIYEHDGWRNDRKLTVPRWRLGYSKTFDGAIQSHMNFVEAAFQIPTWDTRKDVPDWARRIALVTTLHGMHYTGYMFND